MNPEIRAAAFTILGGAAVAAIVGRLLVELEPRPVTLGPRPAGPEPGPGPTPEIPSGAAAPVRLAEPRIPLETGGRYLAAIALSGFLVRTLATTSAVRAQAEKQGFRDVVVTEKRPPAGSPTTATADYYVVGTFDRPDREIGRDHGDGAVQIVDAWRLG